MTYTGRVKPGSPGVHELTNLVITKASVGPMDNNAYLLACRDTGESLLIDAAAEPKVLLGLIGDAGVSAIVTTHQHWDHWGALADVVAATSATTIAGAEDVVGIPVQTDRPVGDGDMIDVGNSRLEVIHLVGHTPGSVALLYDDPAGPPHLWTGDCLFPGGPGRTTNPTDFSSLMDDLEAKVFDRLPDETWFYPGHGDDGPTLGDWRKDLPAWRERGW